MKALSPSGPAFRALPAAMNTVPSRLIPDSYRSSFWPFHLQPSHAFLGCCSLCSPAARSRIFRAPFPGRIPFLASPCKGGLANASGRIEFNIVLFMDCHSLPVAPHPVSRRRSYLQLRTDQCSCSMGTFTPPLMRTLRRTLFAASRHQDGVVFADRLKTLPRGHQGSVARHIRLCASAYHDIRNLPKLVVRWV
jgi:hypothetical protein